MARIKLAYIGGGSTRAPGTMAALIANHGPAFAGSEVALVDLDPGRLDIVRRLASRMAEVRGLDIRFTATTDRCAGLADADAVLTSYRPGGFEARTIDERIPLRHAIIGQETQGPGGFFMALRSIHVLKGILDDIAAVAPRARVFNYTNPVNILADAVQRHSEIPFWAFCEGAYDFPRELARAAGLEPERLTATMVGLNHATWSVEQAYDGADVLPILRDRLAAMRADEAARPADVRLVDLAVRVGAVPASYLCYFYFHDEILAELQARPTTRAEDIVGWTADYWRHYAEQADAPEPALDPARSRGGIFELELALHAMDSHFNDLGDVMPVNTRNDGALPGFPDDLAVEVWCRVDRAGVQPVPSKPLPAAGVGLIKHLAEYQRLAADAAWHGSRGDAIVALTSHPWIGQFGLAERLYDEMAAAHRAHLPARLLA